MKNKFLKKLSCFIISTMILSNFSYLGGTKIVKADEGNNLIISEMCDPKGGYQTERYIEIYNASSKNMDLSGWKVIAVENNSNTCTWELSGSIEAGKALTCGKNDSKIVNPTFKCEWSANSWNGKGGDGAKLINPEEEVVDDASDAKFENKTIVRNSNIGTPNNSFEADEWTALNVKDVNAATPGEHSCDFPGSTPPQTKVAEVKASPEAGEVEAGTSVELSTSTTSAAIFYTVDGSDPENSVTESTRQYVDSIIIDEDKTIKAIAVKDGLENSDISEFVYTIKKELSVSTIEDARILSDGTEAVIEGVITARIGDNIYMQDDTAGIIARVQGIDIAENLGDKVKVIGKITDFHGMAQINPAVKEDITVVEKDAGVPTPEIINSTQNNEEVEGELVQINNVTVESVDENGNFKVVDSEGETIVKTAKEEPLIIGKTYESIVGVVTYNYDEYKIYTRTENDIVEGSNKVEKVTSTPIPGIVEKGIAVNLETLTEGATIYYTVDGSDPDNSVTESTKQYVEPIIINESQTIKAIAVKDTMTNSSVATFEYIVNKVAEVKASPEEGEVEAGTSVELSTDTDGATIYYTVNGDVPDNSVTESTKQYGEPIIIDEDKTIKAIAVKDGLENSDIAEFTYTIKKELAVSTIADARILSDGTEAVIEGVITAYFNDNIYMQDDTAGIIARVQGIDITANLGDKVKVIGKIIDYYGMAQINPAANSDVSIIENNVGVPTPQIIKPTENNEEVEGELVQINNVTVESVDEKGNFKVVNSEDEETIVKPAKEEPLTVGKTYESIVGVVTYNWDEYKIYTRTQNDIVEDSSMVSEVTAIPNSGIVEKGTKVELKTSTEGAKIYYTVDETEPNISNTDSTKEYVEPITINENKTIKAIAVKDTMTNSSVSTFEYIVKEAGDETRIRDIQGKNHVSLLKGNEVKEVKGVVTAVVNTYYDKGFYMQDVNPDSDDKTSEGIYVNVKNSGVSVGDLISVDGKVDEVELYPFDGQLSITQIKECTVRIESNDNTLPEPIIIGEGGRKPSTTVIDNDYLAKFEPQEDALDFYESLEGMLVQINEPLVVGVTEKYGEIVVLPDNGEASSEKMTINNGITATVDNFNPERITIDDGIIEIVGQNKKFTDDRFNSIKVGDKFNKSINGVMSYGFGNYKLFNTEALPDFTDGGNSREETRIVPSEEKLTVASYNIENFSAITDPSKVNKIANSIISELKEPDIIGLIEIQDNNGPKEGNDPEKDGIVDASETYETLINAIKDNGGPEYGYTDIAPIDGEDGGQPTGNIRVGFIYRTDRVTLVSKDKGDATTAVTMEGKDLSLNPGRIYPTDDAFLDSRKSLASEFEFKGEKIFVIANHFCSKGGDDGLFGSNQPPVRGSEVQRHKQAAVINGFVDEILTADPEANIVVLGDMNDYEFSDTLSILKGKDDENVLTNMIEELPKNERFTYVYQGNSQVLDNVLVSNNLKDGTEVDPVNFNSEFVDGLGRASDHDPVIIQITMLYKDKAIKNAIEAIDALPSVEELTVADKKALDNARGLVDAAINLGADEKDITNLSKLIELEVKMKDLLGGEKLKAIEVAIEAINNLPELDELTLEHKSIVENARVLVNDAISLGAEESDITNLSVLEAAEEKIKKLDPNAPYMWNNEIPEKKPAQDKDNGKLILFDNSHLNTAGKADWVLDGAFSDFADALVAEGYTVKEYRGIDKNGDGAIRFYDDRELALDKEGTAEDINEALITYEAIKDADVFVTAESNRPLRKSEQDAIERYIDDGKGIYFIADHYDADRNCNLWDSTEVYNGYNRHDSDKFNIDGVYGDLRNPKDASKGWLSETFGVRYRFNAGDSITGKASGATEIVSVEDSEGITENIGDSLLMAAGSTLAITDCNIAKGIVYFGEDDYLEPWATSNISKIYFGGKEEGPYVAISKPSKGRAAFIGDSSPIEDPTAKYRDERSGEIKSLHNGWNNPGNAAVLSVNIVNWLADSSQDYEGFDGVNHSKGELTPVPMADGEKEDPNNGDPWTNPTIDPWNTDNWAKGAYGAPYGTDSEQPTESIQFKLYPQYVYQNEPFALTVQGTVIDSEFGAYLDGGKQVGKIYHDGTWTNQGYNSLWGESPLAFTAKVTSIDESLYLKVRLSKKNYDKITVNGLTSGYGYIEGKVNGAKGEIVVAVKENKILGTAQIDADNNVKIAVKSETGVTLALYGKDGIKKSDFEGTYNVTDGNTVKIVNGDIPEPTIVKISELDDIVIVKGGDIILPKVVGVTMSDNTSKDVNVTWNTDNLDIDKIGEYNLIGDVEGTDLKAKIKVSVKSSIVNDYPIGIVKVRTIDLEDNDCDKIKLNSTIIVNANIKNLSENDVKGTIIIKIKDSENKTHFIGFVKDDILVKGIAKEYGLGFTMKGLTVGKYTAKVYVWDSLKEMNSLAESGEVQFDIVDEN